MVTAPLLFVISDESEFVSQVEQAVGHLFSIKQVANIELAEQMAAGPSVISPAIIAHLTSRTLNGFPATALVDKLKNLQNVTPVITVVGSQLASETAQQVNRFIRAALPQKFHPEQLRQLLAELSPVEWELAELFHYRPHTILKGGHRAWVTFTPSVFEMVEELRVAAAHNVTLLLIGETGAGKTFLARTIHEISPRAGKRFLTVACGALPPDLIESELFGYVKGAFTGADGNKLGKFAAVDDGTLLLDEIDVLAPEHQAKLLRVIETGEYEPVGSNETHLSRARLIVASNIDLHQLVEQGKFRRDLFYRLNMLSFFIPPLRERPYDIEYLARKFAIEQARSLRIRLRGIEPSFLAALRDYHWPGNVRELENIIRRAVLYCREGTLRISDLPSMMRPALADEMSSQLPGISSQWTLEKRLEDAERQILEEALRRNGYRRQETARELGISRITLYHKMKKYGLMVTPREPASASSD
ncbi:MAG: sigma-54 interaction domain-containing protein [Thermogutta sp.]